jgi:predicted kinase
MNMVLFTGIQATGKSEFCKRNFYKTHIRINLDMLKTRNREKIMIEACLTAKQPFVVDNTNLTVSERKTYIDNAKNCGFEVIGYYFKSSVNEATARNELREGKEKLPSPAIYSAHAKLELPLMDEGYDKLFYVRIENDDFIVEEYRNEI